MDNSVKKISLLAVVFSITLFSAAMAAEEFTLNTVLPSPNILRGLKGAVGSVYRDQTRLPDGSIANGHIYAEGGIDIGTMYDNADPNGHSAYINQMTMGAQLRIGEWSNSYANGTMSGVVGSVAVGTDSIHSFEHLYLAFMQNLIGRGNPSQFYRVGSGGGVFMMLGKTWGTGQVPGLYIRVAYPGAANTVATLVEVLQMRQNKIDVWTFSSGGYTPGTGAGMYADGVRIQPPSDINLKKDISNLPPVLDRIDTIRGVNFKWKDDGDTLTHAGVIAQEVEKRFQELVQVNPAGIKYVSYEGLDGVLVEAVKELKKDNEELRLQNSSVRKMLEELKTQRRLLKERVARLEKKNDI